MCKLGFTCCQAEHVVFYRYMDEEALIVAVDVNDLTMAGSSKHALLGIEVKRDHARHTIALLQRLYIDKILE